MKKRSKPAKKSAKIRELEQSWQRLLDRHSAPLERGAQAHGLTRERPASKPHLPKAWRESEFDLAPSVDTGWASTAAVDSLVYTGDQLVGIAVMHKSCLQPVFSEQAARDSATMRRN